MSNLQITHRYKIWNHGTYLGLLEGVISPFNLNETINTAGGQIQVTVNRSVDTAIEPAQPILDETGNPILDENGNQILDEGVGDIVGDTKASNQMQEDNTIEVWEYSNDYPNGVCVFQGYISKVKPLIGGDNNIVLTCLSNGQDLSNYAIETGDTASINQTTDNGTTFNIGITSLKSNSAQYIAQTFTVAAELDAAGFSVEFDSSVIGGNISAYLYRQTGANLNPNNDVLLSQGAVTVPITASKTVQKISFTSNPTLEPGITYYVLVGFTIYSNLTYVARLYATTANPYANGKLYTVPWNGVSWDSPTAYASDDLYFIVWSHGGNTTSPYTSKDTSYMLNDVMTNYIGQGGQIGIQSGGYSNSGQVTSYTFSMQTLLQGIDTIIKQLAPAGWWYYADPSDSKLYAGLAPATADFTLVKGKHFDSFEPEFTKENIINVVYFTGGDDGTGTNTNIFVKVTDTDSINANRRGIAIISDNRVSAAALGTKAAAEAVGRLIAQNLINENSARTYIATLTVDNSTIDTIPMKIGKMMGFAGNGNFADSLVLQIVSRNRTPDQTTFGLGVLPVRTTQAIKDVQRDLAYLQTVDNPTSPS